MEYDPLFEQDNVVNGFLENFLYFKAGTSGSTTTNGAQSGGRGGGSLATAGAQELHPTMQDHLDALKITEKPTASEVRQLNESQAKIDALMKEEANWEGTRRSHRRLLNDSESTPRMKAAAKRDIAHTQRELKKIRNKMAIEHTAQHEVRQGIRARQRTKAAATRQATVQRRITALAAGGRDRGAKASLNRAYKEHGLKVYPRRSSEARQQRTESENAIRVLEARSARIENRINNLVDNNKEQPGTPGYRALERKLSALQAARDRLGQHGEVGARARTKLWHAAHIYDPVNAGG